MEIGKEAEEPVEFPIPTRAPVRREVVPEPAPVEEPVKEPAHARTVAELDNAVVEACQSVASRLRALDEEWSNG